MNVSVRLMAPTALALLLSACVSGGSDGVPSSGSAPAPAPDGGIQVVSTGSWNDIGLGTKSWGWGVVLANPGPQAVRVDMTVDALNEAGQVVASNPAMWVTVLAGSTGVMAGGFLNVPGDEKVAGIDVSSISTSPSYFGAATLTVSGLSQVGESVSGAVANGSDRALSTAWVHAVHVRNGVVVGGGSATTDVSAGGTAEFTINMTGESTGELIVSADPPYLG